MDPICLICGVPFRVEAGADLRPVDCPACGAPNAVVPSRSAGRPATQGQAIAMPAFAPGRRWPVLALHWRWVAWAAAAILVVGIPWVVRLGHLSIDAVGPLYERLVLLVLALAFVPLYFFPTVIAAVRKHRELLAIFILNALLGWTYDGWVLALVWASLCKVR